jgi:hypothetical protein
MKSLIFRKKLKTYKIYLLNDLIYAIKFIINKIYL